MSVDTKEKKRIYFNWRARISSTSRMLTEKSSEGWHFKSVDEFDTFYFEKGEPTFYRYSVEENGKNENYFSFNQIDYSKIYGEDNLNIFRSNGIDVEKVTTVDNRFSVMEKVKEEQWISEMALEGKFFDSVVDGQYVFFLGEPMGCEYMVDYQQTLSDINEYVGIYRGSGWIYLFGGEGKQYFRKEKISIEYRESIKKENVLDKVKKIFGKK